MQDKELQHLLVQQAKAGDPHALNTLLENSKDYVYAIAFALLKNKEDAEDAMQQALIAVWHSISSLSDPRAFESWLYRVTYTRSLNILKARSNKETILDEDLSDMERAEFMQSELMLPQEYAERGDLKTRLFAIIDTLPPAQRETVVLYYFHEKGVGEIAEIMDCSPGTVKSRLYLARNSIRTEILAQEQRSGEKFFGIAVGIIPLGRFVAESTGRYMLAPHESAQILAAARQAVSYGAAAVEAATATAKTAETAAKVTEAAAKTAETTAKSATATAAKGVATSTLKHTMPFAAKIAIAAAGVAAVASVAGVVIHKELTKPEISEHHAVTVPTMPATTTAPKETQPPEPAADYTEAYRAYLGTLSNRTARVNGYTWQLSNPSIADIVSRPVVFADIMGDDTPEMIVACCSQNEPPQFHAYLNICTFTDGKAEWVYEQESAENGAYLDVMQNTGAHTRQYALFQAEGEKTLYLYLIEGNGFESVVTLRTFSEQDGKLSATDIVRYDVVFDPSGATAPQTNVLGLNGQSISKAECMQTIKNNLQRSSNLLMTNDQGQNVITQLPEVPGEAELNAYPKDFVEHSQQALSSLHTNRAMTFGQAINFLKTGKEQPDYSMLQGTYSQIKNGMTSSTLTIQADGSFTERTEGSSNGYFSQCVCHGQITGLTKTADHTYRFYCTDVRLEHQPGTTGESYYANRGETLSDVHFIDSYFNTEEAFTAYTAGKQPDEMESDDYKTYANWHRTDSSKAVAKTQIFTPENALYNRDINY